MSQNKRDICWLLFNWFGPPEVQNLIDYIDNITEQAGNDEIVIYPSGKYDFTVRVAEGDQPIEPFIFPTNQERSAFAIGLNYGISLFGGTAYPLSKDQFEAMEEMTKTSTHTGGGGRNN